MILSTVICLVILSFLFVFFFFFFNDTATTEIYTLSLHDALPIWIRVGFGFCICDHRSNMVNTLCGMTAAAPRYHRDRKSTRLNSSHSQISYAVFCLKKKKKIEGLMIKYK